MRALLIVIFTILGLLAQIATLITGVIAIGLLLTGRDGAEAWGVACVGVCLILVMSDSIVENLRRR